MKDFCHLHLHGTNSLLDGLGTAKQYAVRAKELGMKHLALTNHSNIDGVIEFQKACDKEGVHAVFGCLMKGQPIICETGVRSVEKIQKGDFVFTHKGRFRPVTRIMQRDYEGLFYKIKLAGMSERILTVTEEHPILVKNGKGELKWLKPSEISFGRLNKIGGVNCWKSWVCFPKIKNEKKMVRIDLLDYLPKGFYCNNGKISKSKQKRFDRDIHWNVFSKLILDEDVAYFLGLFIGDGSTNFRDGKAISSNLTFGIHKLLIARWVSGFLRKRFGIVVGETIRREKSTIELVFSCRPINEWLYQYCGRGAHNKRVPFDIFKCKKEIRQKVIQGLIDTDGKNPCAEKNKSKQICFKVSSRGLAWQFKTLIASLGFWSNVGTVKQCVKGKKCLSYSVTYSPYRKYSRTMEDEKFVYYPIKEISSFRGNAKVYNFEVKDDNSYVSDFVLHNCEMYVVPDRRIHGEKEKRGHIVLLIKNESGWKTICRMLTEANLTGFYYKPRIDYQMLDDYDLSGLIALTACPASFVHLPGGEELLLRIKKKTDIYLEIHPHSVPRFYPHFGKMILLHKKHNIPYVACNDAHYVMKEDTEAHNVLLCVQTKKSMADTDKLEFEGKTIYLASRKEMYSLFLKQGLFEPKDVIHALDNSLKIAEQCTFRLEKRPVSLPKAHRDVSDSFAYLKDLCCRRLRSKAFPGFIRPDKYEERLRYELELIRKKKFSRYFLIVEDLMSWCRANNILTGAGRGSVGGSLVAYLLRITTVDPIKYDLLFSRFISEDRIDLPDIDMDFEDIKREKVQQYLAEKYGKDNVFGISTFIKMKGKTVVRDVARVFDVPLSEVNVFSKNMELDPESESNIEENFKTSEGQEFDRKYPQVKKFALKLENMTKSAGVHAAGLVISPQKLSEFDRGNICMRKGIPVVNWSMTDAEYMGLVKFDLLGLNTLTILRETADEVLRKKDIKINFPEIVPDDSEIFSMISNGETAGIFQVSTWAMTDLVKRMKIDNFNDLVASLALVRPGPTDSGMTDEYIRRKHGGQWRKGHPIKEEILKETYGVCVYQEQVMQMIHQMAGLPYSVADEIRKVIGKKRSAKEFEPYKKQFVDGCLKEKTFSEAEANEFWEGLLKWANYGFNRSHSVGYSLLAYWTAYCKYYYPEEFLCACLTYGGESHKEEYVKMAKNKGYSLIPPKLKISDPVKWKIVQGNLYMPFKEIKGVGDKALEQLGKMDRRVQYSFFKTEAVTVVEGKLGEILNDIQAHDPDAIPQDVGKYLTFNFFDEETLRVIPERKQFEGYHSKELASCTLCPLHRECTKPVPPSQGRTNIAIVGEAPGNEEDEQGKGFVGRAGKLLWDTMKELGYRRTYFHVSNCCHCYPAESKTPTRDQIQICTETYLKEELRQIDCKYALVFGNTGLFAFKGREGGIMRMNGTIEYSQRFGCNVCYVIHPALVLRDPEKQGMFEEGIKNFLGVLK